MEDPSKYSVDGILGSADPQQPCLQYSKTNPEQSANEELNIEEPQWEMVSNDTTEEVEPDVEPDVEHDLNQEVPVLYCCTKCHLYFDKLEAAEKHTCVVEVKTPKENGPFVGLVEFGCPNCGHIYPTYNEFYEHQVTAAKCVGSEFLAIKLECPQCSLSFPNSTALEEHMHIHDVNVVTTDEPILYSCGICNATFRTKRCFDSHAKVHAERPTRTIEDALPPSIRHNLPQGDQFYCEICDQSLDSNLLLIHKNMHLSGPARVVDTTCHICNREFDCRDTLAMHMRLHVAKKPAKSVAAKSTLSQDEFRYKCVHCDRRFKRAHEKVSHERVHTGEKPYKCTVCGKQFRTSYSQTIHLRTHTDVRPYECDVCHKCFKSQSTWAHHVNIHSGERNHKCDYCNKSFATSVQLYAHRKIHTRPFKCSICDRGFASLSSCQSHMQTRHVKKVPSSSAQASTKSICNICGAMYARSKNLVRHMIDQHGIEDVSPPPSPVNNLNPHELEEMDIMGTHFLSGREEVVIQMEEEPEQPIEVDDQSALLIAVANAASQHYNADEVEAAQLLITNLQ